MASGVRGLGECSSHVGTRHFGAWHFAREPSSHVGFEPNAMHVIVKRFVKPDAEGVVVDAGGIDEAEVVFREGKFLPGDRA